MTMMARVFLFLALLGCARGNETVSVAAAANLVHVVEELNATFRRANPDVTVTTVISASGNLVAQIKAGAPYDVFLSADLDYPRALIAARQADAPSLVNFASGRLVLWTARDDLKLTSIDEVVNDPSVKRLAVAHLVNAPYGRAAREALTALKLWQKAQPKIVIGENISQTAQFVETANADAGFVALSLVLAGKLKHKGRWIEVPVTLHTPLDQGAVLTLRGAKNAAAKRYLAFLTSPEARSLFSRFGYATPAS